jgi:hypothetical protein
MASDDESPATLESSTGGRHNSPCSPWCPTRAHPTSRNQPTFWLAGQRFILSHECSPWDFYELFANCESDVSLVLCNKRSGVLVMKTSKDVQVDFNLPQMQHRNILDIYEVYLFKDQMFIISEYLDFSLDDLLRHDIYLTETEVACVISQVRVRPRLYGAAY